MDPNQPPVENYANPKTCFFHVLFKAGALAFYILSSLFFNSFVIIFVVTVLLAALDFWIVKNVSGRILVGLRWWNEINDLGESVWKFESLDQEGEQTPREKAIQSQITAWEDKEKARKDNKAEKQILSVDAWENSKKASREADYKKNEAIAEKVRLKGIEKIKNKEAQTQMEVESKKANIEAKREKAKKEVEEKAEKHRQNKTIPMKCFGGGMCKD